MTRVFGYFNTKVADQIHSDSFTDKGSYIHQPDVEICEIDFAQWTRYPSPLLCWTPALGHYQLLSPPNTAGLTELCLCRSLRGANGIPDSHATLRE